MGVTLGMRGEATLVVGERETAEAYGAGGVRVFATPAMIGLMENACWMAVEHELPDDETTVGVLVHVRHLAATPIGEVVVAAAELVEIDGRRFVFRVSAHDEHRQIGEGTHERMLVNRDRFMTRVERGG